MHIGANMGYFGTGSGPEEEAGYAVLAERLGYRTVWVGEPYGNDAVSVLAFLAARTTTIRLGSAILAIPGRTAAMCGQSAATLDLLSGGRLVLGLGTSGPQVSEGWHGVPFARQLQRTREYVEVVRMVVARERLTYDGETITLPLPDGPGKPLKLILHPPRPRIPLFLAALGPRNLELCGEIADGWLPLWLAPEHMDALTGPLRAGAERAGRDPDELEVSASVIVRVDDDVERARALMRPALALYVGGMGSRQRNFYKELVAGYGYAALADAIQDRYLAGDRAGAADLVPDELVDLVCLCGDERRIGERLRAYAAAGVHEVAIMPAALGAEDKLEQLRRFAAAAVGSGVVTPTTTTTAEELRA